MNSTIKEIELLYGTKIEDIIETLKDTSVRKMVFGKLGEVKVCQTLLNRYDLIYPDPSKIETPWDFKIKLSEENTISFQVKTLRHTAQGKIPVHPSKKLCKHLSLVYDDTYMIHTYKTRNGKDKNGKQTRDYYLENFDILAVPMYPLLSWGNVRYLCSYDSLRIENRLEKRQPVPGINLTGLLKWFDNADDAIQRFLEIKNNIANTISI